MRVQGSPNVVWKEGLSTFLETEVLHGNELYHVDLYQRCRETACSSVRFIEVVLRVCSRGFVSSRKYLLNIGSVFCAALYGSAPEVCRTREERTILAALSSRSGGT